MSESMAVIVSETWKTCMDEICSAAAVTTSTTATTQRANRIVAVVGPKGAGKSTFAKELFTKWAGTDGNVGFLDTDLGRPEFTLPGMVSFHKCSSAGTAASPVQMGALYLGEDDPSQRPEDYLRVVEQLARFAQKESNNIIVNTHGWFAGLGQDVLEAVLTNCGVTDIVQIIPEAKLASLGSLIRSQEKYKVWSLNPAKEGRQREAKLSRERKFVEYFLQSNTYAVGFNKVKIRYPKDLLDRELPPNYALLALNASLVGMTSDDTADENPRGFLGVGLVSAIDVDRRLFLIQSKLTVDEIKQCKLLIPGTSSRVPLNYFPAHFVGSSSDLATEMAESSAQDEEAEKFIPYLTSCKMVGFGLVQHKGILKRRRLDEGGA